MPIAVLASHKTAWMRFWICSLHAIGVDVAFHTCRVIPFRVVARHATLDITPRKLCVLSSTGADADSNEPGRLMACGNRSTKSLATAGMAIVTECLFLMTDLAIRCPAARINAVGKPVINIVDGLSLQRLRFVIAHRPRRDHSGLLLAR